GRCNITNTLPNDEFMERFGRFGRYAQPALTRFGQDTLREFLQSIRVSTHAPDGLHVFPVTHQASTVVQALATHLHAKGIRIHCGARPRRLTLKQGSLVGIETKTSSFRSRHVVIATGGRSHVALGATGDGYELARQAGHTITDTWPAMVPLITAQTWPARCRADTVPKAEISVDLPGMRKCRGVGDLIFTRTGLAGPVVLDFSRHIPPLLREYGTVPLRLCLTGTPHADTWHSRLQFGQREEPGTPVAHYLKRTMAPSLAEVMCELTPLPGHTPLGQLARAPRRMLAEVLAQTPIDVTDTGGFGKAMITRGGVTLKEVAPETLQSKYLPGLFFAGEVLDLDGPCGGFNLQWAFASGYLAGQCAGRQSMEK
ncbi:MAG: aminoacetone oxidase family FAD-binding enzyme, partial [Lentisphaerae bacterium]|nr:aminoacetone oxidase family FAD-binding enzyme [Lentisphaerota bacterium]